MARDGMIVVLLLVFLFVVAGWLIVRTQAEARRLRNDVAPSLDRLKQQYVAGDIDTEEFERRAAVALNRKGEKS